MFEKAFREVGLEMLAGRFQVALSAKKNLRKNCPIKEKKPFLPPTSHKVGFFFICRFLYIPSTCQDTHKWRREKKNFSGQVKKRGQKKGMVDSLITLAKEKLVKDLLCLIVTLLSY